MSNTRQLQSSLKRKKRQQKNLKSSSKKLQRKKSSHELSVTLTKEVPQQPPQCNRYSTTNTLGLFKPSESKNESLDNQTPKKIIFLDIDGVLTNGLESREEANKVDKSKLGKLYEEIDSLHIAMALSFKKEAVDNLKAICEKTNAKIVISSNWKILCGTDETKRGENMALLKALFKLWDLDSYIIDVTPIVGRDFLDSYNNRAREISAWLKGKEIGKNDFVILDDQDLKHSEIFPDNFIKIDSNFLFSKDDANKVLTIFDTKMQHVTSVCAAP